MGTYKEFFEQMSGRATVLEQKSRQLNGKLKRAISAFASDPKSAPEGPLGMDELKSLSEMIREVRYRSLLPKMNSLIQAMVRADKELASIDAQIDQDILSIHSSIMADCGIPLAESERLAELFTRWQEAHAEIESTHRSLSDLANRLELAIESTDVLESTAIPEQPTPQTVEAGPSSGKGEVYTATVMCSVSELLELKNLLISIMASYIHREEFSFELPFCCCKIAACKLARIPSPRPIKYHRKPRIKDAVRLMERRLNLFRESGQENSKDIALFSSLARSCRSMYQQIPEDVRKDELMSVSRFRGFLDGGSGFYDFFGIDAESGEMTRPVLTMPELLRRATGYDRIFLLELLEAYVGGSTLSLESADPEVALQNELIRRSLMFLMQSTDSRLFYTREWVAATLHRFSMDDYALLIPPMNYAHEREDVGRSGEDGHEDTLSKLTQLAKLIR